MIVTNTLDALIVYEKGREATILWVLTVKLPQMEPNAASPVEEQDAKLKEEQSVKGEGAREDLTQTYVTGAMRSQMKHPVIGNVMQRDAREMKEQNVKMVSV